MHMEKYITRNNMMNMANAVANTDNIEIKCAVYTAYVTLLRRHYKGDFCEGFFWDSCDMNPDWLL